MTRIERLKRQLALALLPSKAMTASLPDTIASVLNTVDVTMILLPAVAGMTEEGKKALHLIQDAFFTRDEETIDATLEAVLAWADLYLPELHRTVEARLHQLARGRYGRQ